ncbi:MAG: hypothetical protein AB7G21_10720 [Dehalococcoidia bacterium]
MARIRFLLFIALAAVAGAVLGRVAAEVRRQQEAGEPVDVSLETVKIRVQDVVPGLVAAARVRDTPWSWLHIPSWLAAFGVNLGVGAVGGDLSRIREMAERAAFGFAGLEFPSDEDDRADADVEVASVYSVVTDDGPAPGASAAPEAPSAPPSTSSYAPPASSGGGSVTWTAPAPERREDAPSGFTAFND